MPDVTAVAKPWGEPPPQVFGRGINPIVTDDESEKFDCYAASMVAIAASIITFVAVDDDAAATGPSRVTVVHHEVPARVVVKDLSRDAF